MNFESFNVHCSNSKTVHFYSFLLSGIRTGHNEVTDTDTVLIYKVSALIPIPTVVSVHPIMCCLLHN